MRLLLCLAALASVWAQDTHVILLGTGNPNPEPEHSGPAAAIVSAGNVYVVDSGPGVVRRAAQAGLKMEQLTRLFLTHLHSDHTAGLPDFILTPAVTGRLQSLDIYGPPGTRAMASHIQEAYKEDRAIRLHGLEPSVPQAYVVHAHDVKPGPIYSDDAVRVTAFAVAHGSWRYAYGYRFEARDKVIVLSGDTTYSPALAAAAKRCDMLIHEVYSAKGLAGRTPDWQRYHTAFHTSGPDVGRIAAAVRPAKLVLYHQLPMGESSAEVIEEVRRNFSGDIIYGKDLDVIR
jgi:ribonuclease Z